MKWEFGGTKTVTKRLLSRIANILRPEEEKFLRQIASRSEFVTQCYRMEVVPVRMNIPLEKIRIQGGMPINASHPFVAAIEHGPDELRKFYDRFQPSNLLEMYGLCERGLDGEALPPWELPWMARDERQPPPGEASLDIAHGVSFYGPGTEKKVLVEHQRLVEVRNSIEKNGFLPDRYGDIEGYGLVSDDDYRFFVRGGKHRAAALASLGLTEIPVSFRPNWPTAVYGAAGFCCANQLTNGSPLTPGGFIPWLS